MFLSTTKLVSFCFGSRHFFAIDKKDRRRTISEISILVLSDCIALMYLREEVVEWGKHTYPKSLFLKKKKKIPHRPKEQKEIALCQYFSVWSNLGKNPTSMLIHT